MFSPYKKILKYLQTKINLELVCKECNDAFSPQEKETIIHAFNHFEWI